MDESSAEHPAPPRREGSALAGNTCRLIAVVSGWGAVLSSGCQGTQSALDPQGLFAAGVAELWWLFFWLALAVFVIVMAALVYAIFRSRRAAPEDERSRIGESRFILLGGAALPLVVLPIVLVSSVRMGTALATPPSPVNLVVEVVGHQFWWEVRYPEYQVVTANEIHVPVGQTVEVLLTTADVIHSFWVPSLTGKIDQIPGRTNSIWLRADQVGIYRGQCAEFCGIQHALMGLLVIAEAPEQFASWLEFQQRDAPAPVDPLVRLGQTVFIQEGCNLCHSVRGVDQPGPARAVGPDLTHFGSRRTIAAATVENTRSNLALWILDPHAIKPGSNMPATALGPERLEALVAYLESLEFGEDVLGNSPGED